MKHTDPAAELVAISRVLDDCKVQWWVDSGTLLSLFRDGQLFDISQDKDFDVGMWANDEPQLREALQRFRSLGYRIGRRRYRGRVVKYWLKPPRRSGMKQIDIKMHTKVGSYAVCPGALVRVTQTNTVLLPLARAVQLVVGYAWRRRFHQSWFFACIGVNFTVTSWVIPQSFVSACSRRQLAGIDLPVPEPVEAYLQYRYGNWKTPTTDWVTTRDDGGLRLYSPEELEV